MTRNFDAIFSYNAAESYALAIAVLADRLRGLPGHSDGLADRRSRPLPRRTPRDAGAAPRHGYEVGEPDGVIGTKTKEALADFQGRAGLKPDGRAGKKTLEALRER